MVRAQYPPFPQLRKQENEPGFTPHLRIINRPHLENISSIPFETRDQTSRGHLNPLGKSSPETNPIEIKNQDGTCDSLANSNPKPIQQRQNIHISHETPWQMHPQSQFNRGQKSRYHLRPLAKSIPEANPTNTENQRTLVGFASGAKIYDRHPSNHHRGKINDWATFHCTRLHLMTWVGQQQPTNSAKQQPTQSTSGIN